MKDRNILTALSVLLIALTMPERCASAGELPYELDTGREVSLVAVGGGLAAAALAIAGQQDPLDAEDLAGLDPDDVNAFDRSATRRWSVGAAKASDVLNWILIPAPLAFAAAGRGREEPELPLLMYAETLLLTNSVVGLLKGSTGRSRPYVYNDDPEIPEEEKLSKNARRSFPSGHSANAFAAAVFAGKVYADLYPQSGAKGWVWGAGLAAAATTATLRYAAGHHYPTDILAGAAIGAAVGYGVPRLHQVSGGRVDLGAGPAITFGFTF